MTHSTQIDLHIRQCYAGRQEKTQLAIDLETGVKIESFGLQLALPLRRDKQPGRANFSVTASSLCFESGREIEAIGCSFPTRRLPALLFRFAALVSRVQADKGVLHGSE
ncbi:hypothetical protein AVEN_200296-1 [Araneus ventricosus]|uniref:Uncharacterized protein n=1 Tax=Araneus ventricosus TaxID=182803 RepID=A0A4Y2HI16_ARAVE|nr:hypothetical protein AVEN_200296-1 [Araneus ventricosus]